MSWAAIIAGHIAAAIALGKYLVWRSSVDHGGRF